MDDIRLTKIMCDAKQQAKGPWGSHERDAGNHSDKPIIEEEEKN